VTFLITFSSLGAFAWAVWIYNRLVRDRNLTRAAWSDIGVQLKRRHDLVPKLVEAVRAYAAYESARLEDVVRLRAAAQAAAEPAEAAAAERRLGERLVQLVAVAEAYPELAADAQYLALLRELSEVEDQIQYARRFYNGAVRDYNVRVESVPDLLIAQAFGFAPAEFFELDAPAEALPPELGG
jgi:LemA protein